MIAVTDRATSAIRRMTNTGTYPEAGLRIKSVDEHRFVMTVVPRPHSDDVAVRASGANVYLDSDAATVLSRATLDAVDNASRADQFTLEGTTK